MHSPSHLVNGQEVSTEGLQLNIWFISYCWDFIFISSFWMTEPGDGKCGKLTFTQAGPCSASVEDKFSAGESAAFVSLPCYGLGFFGHLRR